MSVAPARPATAAPDAAAPGAPAVSRLAPVRPSPSTDPDGRPALRLLPAPGSEPPYDDELPARPALHAVGSPDAAPLPAAPAPAAVLLRLVPQRQDPPPSARSSTPGPDDDVRPRTPLAQLPAPGPFAQALVQRLLEVQAGLRPLSQLQRDTSFELFTELEQTLGRRPRQGGPRPSRRDVRSLHVQARDDGVAEVCATVHRAGRSTALALRLEGVSGAWRCTALLGV